MATDKPPERIIFDGNFIPIGHSTAETTLMCCEFNHNASLVAAGLSNGSIKVVKPSGSCPEVYRLNSSTCGKLPVTAVRFLSNATSSKDKENILLATYASGNSVLWHIATGQALSSRKEEGQSLAAAVAPGCESFCTSGSNGHVLVYDASTHTKIRTLEPSKSNTLMDGHVNRVFSTQYHPINPNELISTGWDDTIQFWDIRSPQAVRRISGPHVCGDGLAIHPTNYTIVTASWRFRDTIQLWEYASGKLLKVLQPDLNLKAYATCWTGENHLLVGGSLLAGGSSLNKAVLIDVSRDWVTSSVYGMESGVYDVDYCPTGRSVAVAAGHTLHFGSWKKRSSSQEILVR